MVKLASVLRFVEPTTATLHRSRGQLSAERFADSSLTPSVYSSVHIRCILFTGQSKMRHQPGKPFSPDLSCAESDRPAPHQNPFPSSRNAAQKQADAITIRSALQTLSFHNHHSRRSRLVLRQTGLFHALTYILGVITMSTKLFLEIKTTTGNNTIDSFRAQKG